MRAENIHTITGSFLSFTANPLTNMTGLFKPRYVKKSFHFLPKKKKKHHLCCAVYVGEPNVTHLMGLYLLSSSKEHAVLQKKSKSLLNFFFFFFLSMDLSEM